MGFEMSMKVGKAAREGQSSALKGGKVEYPSKTTMNLAVDPTAKVSPAKTAILGVVLAILVIAFAKFAVVDVLASASSAEAEVSAIESQVEAYQQATADYAEVAKAYGGLAQNAYSSEEVTYADRNSVMALLEKDFVNGKNLQSVVMEGNVMVLTFYGGSLDRVSGVVASLEKSPIVEQARVSSASEDEDDVVVSTITVTLKSFGSEG